MQCNHSTALGGRYGDFLNNRTTLRAKRNDYGVGSARANTTTLTNNAKATTSSHRGANAIPGTTKRGAAGPINLNATDRQLRRAGIVNVYRDHARGRRNTATNLNIRRINGVLTNGLGTVVKQHHQGDTNHYKDCCYNDGDQGR